MSQPPKVLLLYAHPGSQASVVNQILLQPAQDLEHVTVHDLYARYPDFFINVHYEQQLLREHQVIIFQHPLYTYSCPALLKEWQERVLTRNFIDGASGQALTGKYWRSVITTSEPEDTFQIGGSNRYSIEDILRPFELTAAVCHMHWMRPMVIYCAHHQKPEALISRARAYGEWLQSPLRNREPR